MPSTFLLPQAPPVTRQPGNGLMGTIDPNQARAALQSQYPNAPSAAINSTAMAQIDQSNTERAAVLGRHKGGPVRRTRTIAKAAHRAMGGNTQGMTPQQIALLKAKQRQRMQQGGEMDGYGDDGTRMANTDPNDSRRNVRVGNRPGTVPIAGGYGNVPNYANGRTSGLAELAEINKQKDIRNAGQNQIDPNTGLRENPSSMEMQKQFGYLINKPDERVKTGEDVNGNPIYSTFRGLEQGQLVDAYNHAKAGGNPFALQSAALGIQNYKADLDAARAKQATLLNPKTNQEAPSADTTSVWATPPGTAGAQPLQVQSGQTQNQSQPAPVTIDDNPDPDDENYPAKKDGGSTGKIHPYIVNEEGEEAWQPKGGKPQLMPGGEKMVVFPKAGKVITHGRTMQLAKEGKVEMPKHREEGGGASGSSWNLNPEDPNVKFERERNKAFNRAKQEINSKIPQENQAAILDAVRNKKLIPTGRAKGFGFYMDKNHEYHGPNGDESGGFNSGPRPEFIPASDYVAQQLGKDFEPPRGTSIDELLSSLAQEKAQPMPENDNLDEYNLPPEIQRDANNQAGRTAAPISKISTPAIIDYSIKGDTGEEGADNTAIQKQQLTAQKAQANTNLRANVHDAVATSAPQDDVQNFATKYGTASVTQRTPGQVGLVGGVPFDQWKTGELAAQAAKAKQQAENEAVIASIMKQWPSMSHDEAAAHKAKVESIVGTSPATGGAGDSPYERRRTAALAALAPTPSPQTPAQNKTTAPESSAPLPTTLPTIDDTNIASNTQPSPSYFESGEPENDAENAPTVATRAKGGTVQRTRMMAQHRDMGGDVAGSLTPQNPTTADPNDNQYDQDFQDAQDRAKENQAIKLNQQNSQGGQILQGIEAGDVAQNARNAAFAQQTNTARSNQNSLADYQIAQANNNRLNAYNARHGLPQSQLPLYQPPPLQIPMLAKGGKVKATKHRTRSLAAR